MKDNKNKLIHKIFLAVLIQYVSAAIVTFLMLFYMQDFGWLGIVQGIQVSGALLFTVGWFVFINHHGLFDVLFYGVAQFFKNLFGKQMNKSLIEIRESRKPMPGYLYFSLWINGVILIIVGYVIYYNCFL